MEIYFTERSLASLREALNFISDRVSEKKLN